MKYLEQGRPSPYKLNWFSFSVFFRYIASAIGTFVSIWGATSLLGTKYWFLWFYSFFVAVSLLVLAIFIIREARRFTKLGLRIIYAYLLIVLFDSVITFLLNSLIDTANIASYLGQSVATIIIVLLELKYYRRRKSLFVHKREEKVNYYYDADLDEKLDNEIREDDIILFPSTKDENKKL